MSFKSGIRQYLINLPSITGIDLGYENREKCSLYLDDWQKLKHDVEILNRLLITGFGYQLVQGGEPIIGYFIPKPEKQDSFEKIIGDLATAYPKGFGAAQFEVFIKRARAILEKDRLTTQAESKGEG